MSEELNEIIKIPNELSDEQVFEMARGVKKQLEDITVFGFNEVYEDFDDMLIDLWADLPWDYPESRKAMQWIVRQPEFYETAMKLMNMYERNMLLILGESINYIDSELNKQHYIQ